MVTGTVLDTEGNPVEGATITIVATSGRGGKLEVKTNERGRFSQIGLQSGGYNVTAYKEGLGQPQTGTAQVNMSGPAEVDFTLGVTETEVLSAVLTGAFADGVDLSRAGQYDQAIAKFQEALEITEQCSDCWYNIGVAYSQMKDYDKAEPAFKEALALDPAKSDTYTALANVYNAMGRFDEAAEMSAEAAKQLAASGGLNAASVFNQGVILWNGGKIPRPRRSSRRRSASIRITERRTIGSGWQVSTRANCPRRSPYSNSTSNSTRAASTRPRPRGSSNNSSNSRGTMPWRSGRAMSEAAIATNLATVRQRLARTAREVGRDPTTVQLVAVSKTVRRNRVRIASAAGRLNLARTGSKRRWRRLPRRRSFAFLAPGRAPAIEQGTQGGRGLRLDPLDRQRRTS